MTVNVNKQTSIKLKLCKQVDQPILIMTMIT